MRLVFLTGSLVHGGAERHTITLANRLAERGHECHFAYVRNDPSQLARLAGMASVQCLHAARYFDPRALARLARLLRQVRPTHVVAANQYALLYASLARPAAPLAVTWHTTEPASRKEWLQMLYYRPFFWRADWLVYVCENQRRYWRRRGLFARRSEVIHNGVDTAYWQPQPEAASAAERAALGYAPSDLVLGMSAVLRPEKNHVQLVEAIARLRRRNIPARALLIGDGTMRPAIEARALELGVSAHVRITGFRADVRPLVGACDAMVLCSTAVETFSLAALEAMALARPVVQSEIGGAAEMTLPGENGALFPVGDTAALVERLAALADPAARRRMGAAARATVEERFAERAMVERYEQRLVELESQRRDSDKKLRKPAGAY
jgi:glycosyltransferase involved in cell wall biosynthesis